MKSANEGPETKRIALKPLRILHNISQGQISIYFQTVILMKDFPNVFYIFTLIVAITYNHLINHLQNQVSELNFKSNKMIAKQLL